MSTGLRVEGHFCLAEFVNGGRYGVHFRGARYFETPLSRYKTQEKLVRGVRKEKER